MDSTSDADKAVQPVVSPTLLQGLLDADLGDRCFESWWNLGVEDFNTSLPFEETDELMVLASQQYEDSVRTSGHDAHEDVHRPPTPLEEPEIDDLFLAASQCLESERSEPLAEKLGASRRFGAPVSSTDVEQSRRSGVPPRTRGQTSWRCRVWAAWVNNRKTLPQADMDEVNHDLCEDVNKMSVQSLQFWLPKFVLEVRRADQQHYPPDSLYAICSGLQRSLKFCDRAEVKLFSDSSFSRFQSTLDAEMKRLRSLGTYKKKKAEVIGAEHEDMLWNMGLLGDHNPQVLLDTLVFYIGLYFAIRGGEHRLLRFKPSQLELVEAPGAHPYLIFTEFVSKTNQGGLLHRKKRPKEVIHHANLKSPERCLIRLFKLYNSKCPKDRPNDAFYLRPLSKPKDDVWYQRSPVGHNTLATTIPRLFKAAGISGNFTNHSLRATSATRLFDAGLDEQLIMTRTGHSSTGGVRSYKRVTERLQEKTSDILNARPEAGTARADVTGTAASDTKLSSESIDKENVDQAAPKSKIPCISFAGAANFTVNFNF